MSFYSDHIGTNGDDGRWSKGGKEKWKYGEKEGNKVGGRKENEEMVVGDQLRGRVK